MADRNTYLTYKRDQSRLVYWILQTSAEITQQHPSEAATAINSTGAVSLTTLQSLSALIAKHLHPIPATIFRLFESIIDARKETHNLFLNITTSDRDSEVQKSNRSHEHWIDGLTRAFHAMGGKTWKARKNSRSDVPDEDEEEVIFSNQFSTLSLDSEAEAQAQEGITDDGTEGGDVDAATQASFETTTTTAKRKTHKGRKHGKKTKKPRTKRKEADDADTSRLRKLQLESCRIVENQTDTYVDYVMAIYSLLRQMIELRQHLEGVWRKVAYHGLNSAVAASVSKVAIGMIKDTQTQIFVDFPDHDSFETIIQTITRGSLDDAQATVQIGAVQSDTNGTHEVLHQYEINVKEGFLLNCYRDLLDFITDYQQTRSGRPTKAMLKAIRGWDPSLNLAKASQDERLEWRRTFTINWLYDLVNVFSSAVVEHRTVQKRTILLEQVDWSQDGPWSKYRRLFGINEFAADITHLAMQKTGTDIRAKIRPHHVFQLQSMVDSLAVSRGWSVSILLGHVVTPPASDFRPRRDVDMFMDRDHKRKSTGICDSTRILKHLLDRDAMLHGDPKRNAFVTNLVVQLRDDFSKWLGESMYKDGLVGVARSRFSDTNSNGLWEYPPFLCGAGLSEALELSYGAAMLVWDSVPEPTCIVHLHNMLAKRGILKRGIGLWYSLGEMFKECIFNGTVPTSNFLSAFEKQVGGATSRCETFRNRTRTPQVAGCAANPNSPLDVSDNRYFKLKTIVGIYRAVNWIPDRVPSEDIPTSSALGFLRVTDTKQIKNPVTSEVRLDDTDLVKRFRALGMEDRDIIYLASQMSFPETILPEFLSNHIRHNSPKGCSVGGALPRVGGLKDKIQLSAYLDFLERDFISEICGESRPFHSELFPYPCTMSLGVHGH